jgi:hypothetical protein
VGRLYGLSERLRRAAGLRIPLRGVGLFLEAGRGEIRPIQIARILDDRGDRQVQVVLQALLQGPVLGDQRVGAIRDALLAEVAAGRVEGEGPEPPGGLLALDLGKSTGGGRKAPLLVPEG